MARTQRLLLPLFVLSIALCGCQGKRYQSSTDLAMQRMDKTIEQYGEHFTYMIDNAILHDMSVSDIHFVGHTSEISGVGQARLERMGKLLNTYGGTVRYDTSLRDEDLVEQRMDHVVEYLTLVGVDMSRVEVKRMMAGGRGMEGQEAVKKHRQGTSSSPASGGSTTIVTPLGN